MGISSALVGVQRDRTRARHRTVAAGGGAEAEVWLEYGASRVTFHTRHRTATGSGSGTANWEKCGTTECLGAKLPNSGACVLHAEEQERSQHYGQVQTGRSALLLNGVIVSQALWTEALDRLSLGGSAVVPGSILCSGSVFPFQVQASELVFSQSVSFQGAVFEAGLQFESCEFGRGLYMEYADFDDSVAILRNCIVGGELASRYGHMDMDRQHLAFIACDLKSDALMTGFCGDLRFEECSIQGSLDLASARLSHLSLRDFSLGRQLEARDLETQSLRASNASFESATTIGPFSARWSDFSHALFGSRVQIILKGERASFRNATWQAGGRLEVEDVRLDCESLVLGGPVALIGRGEAALSSMRDADAGSLSVSTMDLSRCIFRGAHRLQEMSVDSTVTLPWAPGHLRTRRRCIADEFGWRARHTRWRRSDWSIPGTVLDPSTTSPDVVVLPDLRAAEVAGVYRALRKALESEADEPGASDFYYGEMEMRRLDTDISWAERLVIFIYWLVAGYGLRATRALGWLVLAILGGAIALASIGHQKRDASLADGLLTAIQAAIPGVPTVAELTQWGQLVDILLTMLGPLLLAFAALALRNRVKR